MRISKGITALALGLLLTWGLAAFAKAPSNPMRGKTKAAATEPKKEVKAPKEKKAKDKKPPKVQEALEPKAEVAPAPFPLFSSYEGDQWEYKTMKLRPPKNRKWQARWNTLGKDGWELIDHVEHFYIFKRQIAKPAPPPPPVIMPAVEEPTKAPKKAPKKGVKSGKKPPASTTNF